MQTAVETPQRSDAQKMAALKKANDTRKERAKLKKRVKYEPTGHKLAVHILTEVPPWFHTMKVLDLLKSMPGLGPVKAGRILGRTRVSPSKTLGGITERQRREIIAELT